MDEAQLLEHVAAEHRLEVKRLFAAYANAATATGSGPSIEGFAHALHQRGLISADALAEFMTFHALDVSSEPIDEATNTTRAEVMTLLGAGAMGEVYLGRDPSLKRTVAVKRAHRELYHDEVRARRDAHAVPR